MTVNLKLTLRGRTYYVTGSVQMPGETTPKRVRKSTGFGKEQLAEAQVVLHKTAAKYADTITSLGGRGDWSDGAGTASPRRQTATLITVGDVIDIYMTTGPKVGATSQGILERCRKDKGHVLLVALSYAELHAWFNRPDAKGRARQDNTINREVAALSAAFNFARKIDKSVPEFDWIKRPVDDARCRWLTVEEREKLVRAFPDVQARRVAEFLFHSGARLGNALTLRWDEVLLGREVAGSSVRLWSRKGRAKKKRWRTVPMTSRMWKIMTVIRDERGPEACKGEAPVFLRSDGKAWGDLKNFRVKHWDRACQKAGIEDFTPHDARHTFCSHLVQKNVPLVVVMELIGHTSLAMVQRYAHLAPSHHVEAVAALEGAGISEALDGLGASHIVPERENGDVLSHHPGAILGYLGMTHTLTKTPKGEVVFGAGWAEASA